MEIIRGPVFKAQKVVVYGPEGIGKSTFAASFPEPLFIDTEGSTNLMDVARVPKPSSWTMMMQTIQEVKKTPGCCKTLIIDTIDWAEQLCVAHVCSIYDKKGIEDFGYGKGYIFVKEEFGKLLNLLSDVTEVGINIVLTAHSTIRKFELPDECGSYDRYELKLGNKTGSQTSALVKEWADMVLFANYKQYVVEVDKKKKAQGGTRVMHSQHHPCWDAKNRHDLATELAFDYASIAYCIPNDKSMQQATPVPVKVENKAETPKSVQDKNIADHDMYMYHPESDAYWILKKGEPLMDGDGMSHEISKEEYEAGIKKQKEPAPIQPTTGPKPQPPAQNDLSGVPPKLADLMKRNNVTVQEIQEAVSSKGYYPVGTPLENYDQSFIDGCLIAAWDQVFNMIEQQKIPF